MAESHPDQSRLPSPPLFSQQHAAIDLPDLALRMRIGHQEDVADAIFLHTRGEFRTQCAHP
jgi:hypothetical protein